MSGRLIGLIFLLLPMLASAEETAEQVAPLPDAQIADFDAEVTALNEPLYTPFIERYVLDELKQLRTDTAALRHEMIQQIVDREINAVDKAISYSTNTVTYFFYLIAGATSILVLVGWTSIREIRERVHSLADEEISKLVTEYEHRLHAIEQQLNQKTLHIEENREEIERTQDLQSLWLRAAQEHSAAHKIGIYDQILKIKRDDCEALTYKADAVLELGEPQWASNLCHQALLIDPENSHAFYQLACSYSALGQLEEALYYLKEAIQRSESYRDEITQDPALDPLQAHPGLQKILFPSSE
ncbi:MAG: hypothetical protein RQ732_01900 [Methylophaga sp.]|nr:hypothetical protein [Methylophaga sp.]